MQSALYSSQSVEWYTPPQVFRAVVAFLGEIDLDPCADPACRVPARTHYVAPQQDGLNLLWTGRVFVNPPFKGIGRWVQKALSESVSEAVLLVPARTDTAWFQPLYDYPICFLKGRLRFSGHVNSAPFPSALVYIGPRRAAFAAFFRSWGPVLEKVPCAPGCTLPSSQ